MHAITSSLLGGPDCSELMVLANREVEFSMCALSTAYVCVSPVYVLLGSHSDNHCRRGALLREGQTRAVRGARESGSLCVSPQSRPVTLRGGWTEPELGGHKAPPGPTAV